MLQRMRRNNKEKYREHRKRTNKICREKKREMLKREIESIEGNRERVDAKKYYQTVNRFRTGYQPHLNACKDNRAILIEGEEKILEHWATYFETQFEKESSNEENEENKELLLTAEPLVKEPSQEELEKAIYNLNINKAPGEDDIAEELIKKCKSRLQKEVRCADMYNIER